jgi:hypothetical protein
VGADRSQPGHTLLAVREVGLRGWRPAIPRLQSTAGGGPCSPSVGRLRAGGRLHFDGCCGLASLRLIGGLGSRRLTLTLFPPGRGHSCEIIRWGRGTQRGLGSVALEQLFALMARDLLPNPGMRARASSRGRLMRSSGLRRGGASAGDIPFAVRPSVFPVWLRARDVVRPVVPAPRIA